MQINHVKITILAAYIGRQTKVRHKHGFSTRLIHIDARRETVIAGLGRPLGNRLLFLDSLTGSAETISLK